MDARMPPLSTVDQAALALEQVRTRIPALVQAYPDLTEFLAVFRALCVPLLAQAQGEVRDYLVDELDLILVELRAWPAMVAGDSPA